MTQSNPAQTGSTCLPNIGPRQRRIRMVSGMVMLTVASAGLLAEMLLDVARLWRVLLFLPVFWGVTGVLQARAKT